MLKIYSLYLASSFILPFLVSTTFFVAFLLTFEMFRVMQMLTASDISIWFLAQMMGDIAVTLIPMAIPLSIYFSAIFCMGRLSSDSEYIALRSFGVDKKHLIRPFILISMIVSINVYFLNQELIPSAHRKVRQAFTIISSTSLIQGIKSGQFFTNISNFTLFPSYVNEETKELKDVFLHMYNANTQSERVIFAKEGQILYSKNPATGIESFKLFLKEGNIVEYINSTKNSEKILFDEYELPISQKRFSYKTDTKEVMMNRSELNKFIDQGLEVALQKNYKKKDFFNAKYEYWNRLNTPLLCIILTLLGFSLGVKGNRGHGKNASGKAILILIGYYIVFFGLVSLARDGRIPVALAIIIPASGLVYLFIKNYKKLDWQG